MQINDISTLDLKFRGIPGAIASYLVPHKRGAVLVECGPGSTIPVLQAQLVEHGFTPSDITDVLLTHIHLDHAGAAGWFAQHGANIHVHPVGAPHLLKPEKLLSSAARIYGDQMGLLWGEFLPHFAYLLDGICFCGDIGGVRMAGARHLRLPMPPPEFHPHIWRQSLIKLRQHSIIHLLPTHFGVFSDVGWYLDAIERALDDVEIWMEEYMPQSLPDDELKAAFIKWEADRSRFDQIEADYLAVYQTANPVEISLLGIQRYWKKNRQDS